MVINTEIMTGQHSERETRGSTVLNGMSSNPSPQSSGIHMEEEKESVKSRGSQQLQGKKAFSRHNMSDAHVNTQRLVHVTACIGPA